MLQEKFCHDLCCETSQTVAPGTRSVVYRIDSTFGFLGTELLVDGAVEVYPQVGIAVVIAAALNGIAVVQVYFRLFTGTRYASSVPLGIRRRERFAVLTLAALILGGGLLPQPGVASRHHAATAILQQRQLPGASATPSRDVTPEHP